MMLLIGHTHMVEINLEQKGIGHESVGSIITDTEAHRK